MKRMEEKMNAQIVKSDAAIEELRRKNEEVF
jgi:hypothetical protein